MGKFSSLAGTGKPHRVFIKLAGERLVDREGKQAYIDVHSDDSELGRKFDKEWREKTLAWAAEMKPLPTQIEHNAAKCAALTAGWYLINPETLEPIDAPATVENAAECYSQPEASWLWGQAWTAALNHANFIKRSAKNSTSSQSGTSETGGS